MTRWSSARWAEIKALFHDLSELPDDQRDVALQERAIDDPEVRAQLRRMLEHNARETSRLEGGAAGLLPSLASPPAADNVSSASTVPSAGSRVGPFEILGEVGRGGMGIVYEATRREGHGVERVAIKVLPPTPADALFVTRFASEQGLLRQLDHPAIAHFVDSGWTPQGRPWFAMAYVDGMPIDAWCNSHGATPTQRATLVRDICAAVQHAHDREVLHRDIKPSNILVTPDGHSVLVDFGIARPLHDHAPGTLTRAGFRPMSLSYTSPEHMVGRPLTAASDVYSLGAVLYMLLAGHPPTSRRLLPSVAANRADIARFDVCTMTAIAYSPRARYATARALADAITSILDD